jgi:hypothetical protein
VRRSPLGTAVTTGLLYQPQMTDDDECGAVGGMRIGRRNRSTRRKPTPAPLCPQQIPHDQTRARTRAAAVGSQQTVIIAPYFEPFKSSPYPHIIFLSLFNYPFSYALVSQVIYCSNVFRPAFCWAMHFLHPLPPLCYTSH